MPAAHIKMAMTADDQVFEFMMICPGWRLGSAIDRDRKRLHRPINGGGRIYETRGGPDQLRPDDQAAIQHAKELTSGREIELWDGARFVARIKSKDSVSKR